MNGSITYEHVAYFLGLLVALTTLVGAVAGVARRASTRLGEDHKELRAKVEAIHNEFMNFQLEVARTYTPMAAMVALRSEMTDHFTQIRADIASLRDAMLKGKSIRG